MKNCCILLLSERYAVVITSWCDLFPLFSKINKSVPLALQGVFVYGVVWEDDWIEDVWVTRTYFRSKKFHEMYTKDTEKVKIIHTSYTKEHKTGDGRWYLCNTIIPYPLGWLYIWYAHLKII